MLRAPHCDIHCKNVRYPNGIRAACSGAERGAYESMSPQAGIRPEPMRVGTSPRPKPTGLALAAILFLTMDDKMTFSRPIADRDVR